MNVPVAARLPFHYGWIIVAAGLLTSFACLGLGRLALGMLLPSMGAALALTYDQMGWISTANFVGYLVAVVGAARLVRRLGSRRVVAAGLATIAVSMMLIARADGFLAILALYLLTGLGTGAANVPIMALVTPWFGRRMRGRAAGIMVSGSGLGIVFAGATVPAINAALGADGWRVNWLVLGMVVLAAAATVLTVVRNHPGRLGLEPLERPLGRTRQPAAPIATPVTRRSPSRVLAHLGAIYFLFGFTYVIYATFIVTALVKEHGFSEAAAGRAWAWAGLLSLCSGPGFGALSDRFGRRVGLGTVFALQTTAYLLAAAPLPDVFLYVSLVVYGLVAWAVPGIMAAAVGDQVGPERAAGALGLITLCFGVGQIAGPALAGKLADLAGSFAPGFTLAAILTAAAVALTAMLDQTTAA